MGERVLVERFADGADATVHHVGGGDDVGSSISVADGGLGEKSERGVVVYITVFDDAAVAVAQVFAEADIAGDEQLVADGFANGADGLSDDGVLAVSAGGFVVFFLRQAE